MNKIFKKIRIISSNYIITYHKELKGTDGGLLDGDISESKKEIKIIENIPYQRKLQVILHEAMHGMKWELCFSGDGEDKNILLTTGLTCFIRDNPEFIMEYIKVLNQKL